MSKKILRLAGTTRANGRYVFSEKEKKEIALKLANRQMDKGIVEDEKKSVMSQYKDRIDRIVMDINKMSRNLIDGYEHRDFECHVDIDWAKNMKFYVAVESGKIVAERPLDPSDYQLKIDFKKPENKEKEKPTNEDNRPDGTEHKKP